MMCYINKVKTDRDLQTDVKTLIPDAALRRRMSSVVKKSVATAVECLDGVENIDMLDAIITATGWGCLADSEKFLRNVINDREQLLNPTPFIQSTFNTVGGQIALLRHNSCYNVTYVNRSHSFEDAMLDAVMRIADGESKNVLVGAFDERTPSQNCIMERMGLFRQIANGEGCVFVHVCHECDESSIARLVSFDFPICSLSKEECIKGYASRNNAVLLYNSFAKYGLFPTASACVFAEAIELIHDGADEVIVYNEYLGASPVIYSVQCIG